MATKEIREEFKEFIKEVSIDICTNVCIDKIIEINDEFRKNNERLISVTSNIDETLEDNRNNIIKINYENNNQIEQIADYCDTTIKYISDEFIHFLNEKKDEITNINNKSRSQFESIYNNFKLLFEKSLNNKIKLDENNMNINKLSNNVNNIVNIEKNINEDIIKEESKGGLITGGAVAGLAGYVAWLGPGAAYINIGNAIEVFFPPLLIAGLAGGLALSFIKAGKDRNQKKIDFNKNIEIAVNKIRKNINDNVFKSLLDSLCSISNKYKYDFIYESESLFSKFDFDKSECDKIISDFNVYIKDLRELITEYDAKLN